MSRTRLALIVVLALVVAAIPVVVALRATSPGPDATSAALSTTAPAATSALSTASPAATPAASDCSPLRVEGLELPCLDPSSSANQKAADHAHTANTTNTPLILNLWAWWCAPCREELPIFAEVAAAHPDWRIAGVHLDRSADAGRDFAARYGAADLPHYADPGRTLPAALSLPQVVPITLVYRADGTYAGAIINTVSSPADLEAKVQELL